MNSSGTSNLLWRACEDGYEWIHKRYFPSKTPSLDQVTGPEWFLVDGKKVGEQFKVKQYDPMKHTPWLFRTFGNLSENKNAIREFANEYGLLGETKLLYQESNRDPSNLEFVWGELFQDWIKAIRNMRWAIQIWDWIEQRNVSLLSHHITKQLLPPNSILSRNDTEAWVFQSHPGQPIAGKIPGQMSTLIRSGSEEPTHSNVMVAALFLVQDWINEAMKGHVNARLLYHVKHSKQMLFFVPSTLLSAMWLQLAETVAGSKKHRQCKECGRWFEISNSKDARTERRIYCSNACKVRDFRRRPDSNTESKKAVSPKLRSKKAKHK